MKEEAFKWGRKTGRKFTTWDNGSGYRRITLDSGKRVYLHRHLAGAKKGEIVHHKDENKKNNFHSNLEINNQSEHCRGHAPHLFRWGKPISDLCLICGVAGKIKRGHCPKHYQFVVYHSGIRNR